MRISSIFESKEGSSGEDISPERLIESCLLKAASLITDGQHRAERKTERIEILRSIVDTCCQGNLINYCKSKQNIICKYSSICAQLNEFVG